jgi:hypothetical protein
MTHIQLSSLKGGTAVLLLFMVLVIATVGKFVGCALAARVGACNKRLGFYGYSPSFFVVFTTILSKTNMQSKSPGARRSPSGRS